MCVSSGGCGSFRRWVMRRSLCRALTVTLHEPAYGSRTFDLPAAPGLAHNFAFSRSQPTCHPSRREMLRRIVADALRLFERESSNPRLFRAGRPSQGNPPDKPGLYRLIRNDDGSILYIGQTSNLANRIREHERHSFPEIDWFAAWKAIVPCFTHDAYQLLLDLERTHIARHRPAGVRAPGGEGAPPRTVLEPCPRTFRRCRHPGECDRWGARS